MRLRHVGLRRFAVSTQLHTKRRGSRSDRVAFVVHYAVDGDHRRDLLARRFAGTNGHDGRRFTSVGRRGRHGARCFRFLIGIGWLHLNLDRTHHGTRLDEVGGRVVHRNVALTSVDDHRGCSGDRRRRGIPPDLRSGDLSVAVRPDDVVVDLMDLERGGRLHVVVVLRQAHPVLDHVLTDLEVVLHRQPLEVVRNIQLDDAQVADLLRKVLLRIYLSMDVKFHQ